VVRASDQAAALTLTGRTTAVENPWVIFYLMSRRDWESPTADPVAEPGKEEGFVHCCDERQIVYVRRSYFPVDEAVVAVAFDPALLSAETRYEPGTGGEPERFPHVYGALQREFVASVRGV
jgi:uncharacterized protein (DUF952 family)